MRLDGPGWGAPRFVVMVEPTPTRWIVWDNEVGVPASFSVASYTEAEKLRPHAAGAEASDGGRGSGAVPRRA
jgi:hypothetical protein